MIIILQLYLQLKRRDTIFSGWYSDKSFDDSTKIVFPYEVINDITLYAKWMIKSTEGLEYEYQAVSNSYYVSGYVVNNKDVRIPETYNDLVVTGIKSNAFQGNTIIETVSVPNSITDIGFNAFSGCSKLETITFESGSALSSISYGMFNKCSALTSITIPNEVTSIGSSAFAGCSKLETITFESGSILSSIGLSTFASCKGITNITIPNSVTSIGSEAFRNCSTLTGITFLAVLFPLVLMHLGIAMP